MKKQLSLFLSIMILFSFCFGIISYADDNSIEEERLESFNEKISNEFLDFNHEDNIDKNISVESNIIFDELNKTFKTYESFSIKSLNANSEIVYEREPNNYGYEANKYNLSNSIAGRFPVYYDLDWFEFTITKPGIFVLIGTFIENYYTPYLSLDLYDSNENILTTSKLIRSEGNYFKEIVYQLNPGTYYILAFQRFTKDSYSPIFNVDYLFTSEMRYDKPQNISVESIKLNKSDIELDIGNSESLTAIIEPSNATNTNVKWESSNNSIVAVNSDGLAKGIKEGKATIIVTTEDGNYSDSCKIEVFSSDSNYDLTHKTTKEITKLGDLLFNITKFFEVVENQEDYIIEWNSIHYNLKDVQDRFDADENATMDTAVAGLAPWTDEEYKPKPDYTFGSSFIYDAYCGKFKVSVGKNYSFDTIRNRYSENDGDTVVRIPVTVENIGNETGYFYNGHITGYNSLGNLSSLSIRAYFDDGRAIHESMRPGAKASGAIYILYSGAGNYYLTFKYTPESVELELPIH